MSRHSTGFYQKLLQVKIFQAKMNSSKNIRKKLTQKAVVFQNIVLLVSYGPHASQERSFSGKMHHLQPGSKHFKELMSRLNILKQDLHLNYQKSQVARPTQESIIFLII